MIIRPALASDAAAVESLFREFVTYLRSIGDDNEYRFSVQQYLRDGFGPEPAFRGLVAEDESGLLGYLLFCRTYDGEYIRNFYIIDIYVRGSSRGRGIGRMLMSEVRHLAVAEEIPRLSWSVHKKNAAALRFYEAMGAQYATESHVMYLDLLEPPAVQQG
jgi:ribosomal protein S18 acetylase RimI-like enzyme